MSFFISVVSILELFHKLGETNDSSILLCFNQRFGALSPLLKMCRAQLTVSLSKPTGLPFLPTLCNFRSISFHRFLLAHTFLCLGAIFACAEPCLALPTPHLAPSRHPSGLCFNFTFLEKACVPPHLEIHSSLWFSSKPFHTLHLNTELLFQ